MLWRKGVERGKEHVRRTAVVKIRRKIAQKRLHTDMLGRRGHKDQSFTDLRLKNQEEPWNDFKDLAVVSLGTSSGRPTGVRNVSATAIKLGGHVRLDAFYLLSCVVLKRCLNTGDGNTDLAGGLWRINSISNRPMWRPVG